MRLHPHLHILFAHRSYISFLIMPLHQGGSGVRASGYLPPRSLVEGRCQGPGYLLHRPLHRLLQEGRPPNCIVRRSSTRDSVPVSVEAVIYMRVRDATAAETNVEDYSHSTRLLAATTLRNVLGTRNLAEILSERESISATMQSSLDDATDPWGVKVERVEIKDVRLPVQLQRAMAAEAEAAREARAKVIAAEGEQRASKALKEAAEVINESPAALQLRYMQTLNAISAEKNSTIIFPLPIDLLSHYIKDGNGKKKSKSKKDLLSDDE
ncbi:band 7 protein AAEL010189-like isoform X7 [Macrobrachium nipponense]|uniref:band 7 protein AAEL010189-like isoform X7 n=1 Tax=Macrobrachium nipponense TaxID=159736 RepID=UPI0030C7B481